MAPVMHQIPVVPPGGKHLIVEVSGVDEAKLTDSALIEDLFRRMCAASGATFLFFHAHPFTDSTNPATVYGITALAMLAESHITIHTWPETGYAAIDVFMCGHCDPAAGLPILRQLLKPKQESISLLDRQPPMIPGPP